MRKSHKLDPQAEQLTQGKDLCSHVSCKVLSMLKTLCTKSKFGELWALKTYATYFIAFVILYTCYWSLWNKSI